MKENGADTPPGMYVEASALEPTSSQATLAARVYERLLQGTLSRPGAFADEVVTTLVEELHLSAATIYLNCPEVSAFKLKAAAELDFEAYADFMLPNPSYLSWAVRRPGSILIDLPPFDPRYYRDSELLRGKSLGGIVVVPFSGPEFPDSSQRHGRYPSPLGGICLYAREASDLEELASVAVQLDRLIGTLYITALDRLLMDMRSEAVKEVAFKSHLTDVAHKILGLTRRHLFFEAGSLWLLDPRKNKLVLRAADPDRKRDGMNLIQHEIFLDSPQNPLALSYRTGSVIYARGAGGRVPAKERVRKWDERKIIETVKSPIDNGLAYPLRLPESVVLGNEKRTCLGVFSVMNKFIRFGNVRRLACMTWEDLRLLDHMAEIASVLVFQSLRVSDHEAEYERRVHGLTINLIGARSFLEELELRGRLSDVVQPQFQHHVPNAIEWMLEMEQQVGRADRIDRLSVTPERTLLYRDVLQNVYKTLKRSAHANDVKNLVASGQSKLDSQSRSIPPVLVDRRAMHTVFRNLIENSIKYRDKEAPRLEVGMSVHWGGSRKQLELHYWDNGIGIEAKDSESVFVSGFRGKTARVVHVAGSGLGLHECRALMDAQGGSIRVEPISSPGSHFVLSLPLAGY